MAPTPESNEKMIKKNRIMINKLIHKLSPNEKFADGNQKTDAVLKAGGIATRDYGKRKDGTFGPSIVKPGKKPSVK